MSKEMFIASSPHETRVALCEDDQLVELYLERDTDVGLVGGIYKGRVNRVLPGMQSAFVNIGLERDAFLYVSDFFMQGEEFEGMFEDDRPHVVSLEQSSVQAKPEIQPAAEGEPAPLQSSDQDSPADEAPSAPAAAAPPESSGSGPGEPATSSQAAPPQRHQEDRDYNKQGHHGRRRRRRGRGRFGDQKFAPRHEVRDRAPEPAGSSSGFEVLPGESLAKYSHSRHEPEPAEALPETDSANSRPDSTGVAEISEPPVEAKFRFHEPEPEKANLQKDEPESQVSADPVASSPSPVKSGIQYSPELSERRETSPSSVADPGVEAEHEDSEVPSDDVEPSESQDANGDEEDRTGPEDIFPEGVSQETMESSSEEQAGGAQNSSEPGTETPAGEKRQFTLRDQHSRPHFAPRRRHRGRRGMRRGRRYEKPRESVRSGNNQPVQISELLKEGQEILVQIAKEPLGTKGARITSHIALPGRYLVYMPTITHIGVSRKISSEQERLRLRNLILENRGSLTGGFIVRTAAEGRSDDELKADLKFLTTLWTDIRSKAESSKAPALIYRDLDLVQRILRDTLTPDFKAVRVDNEMDYERIVDFISRAQPALLQNVKLHTREIPLFDDYGIQQELEKALRPKVWLRSGGYIVINQTEALVAIDVNTGKYVGKTNRLEDTILKTNVDAVKEIVRQLRLRDLGGIIVVDFIDMDERRNRNRVVQALEEALRHDRAPTKVLAFNEFGLVALTRKRVKQSLQRTLCDPCEYCSGSGWVKSVTTVCNEILSEARKIAQEIEGKTITLRVNPAIARELKSKNGLMISEIESAARKAVAIKSDPSVNQERFEIF